MGSQPGESKESTGIQRTTYFPNPEGTTTPAQSFPNRMARSITKATNDRRAVSPALAASLGEDLDLAQSKMESGQPGQAARILDRIWRTRADARARIALTYGLALASAGDAEAAWVVLSRAAELAPGPDAEAAIVGVLLERAQTWAAADRLTAALSRFAVSPGDALALAARRLSITDPDAYPGWCALSPSLDLVGEVRNLAPLCLQFREPGSAEWCSRSLPISADGHFRIALRQLEPKSKLRVRVAEGSLLPGEFVFPGDFALDGRIEEKPGCISGWARLGWSPTNLVQIELRDDFGARLQVVTENGPADDPSPPHFCADSHAFGGERIWVSAQLPDGRWAPLPDSPLLLRRGLKAVGRATQRIGRKSSGTAVKSGGPRAVDVIVPAYLGLAETARCLHSVLGTVGSAVGIVVIDDASPDIQLREELDRLAAADPRISLLRNDENLGFTASVNRGMHLHPDRDVVLLNSDTVVFENWLARLQAAAYRSSMTGTATPWSNDGSLVSHPAVGKVMSEAEAREVDHSVSRIFAERDSELPVGVGFCLYVRRDCLNEVGPFDEQAFTRGYGEETDFCMRARLRGWRHRLATDVFVLHVGGRSFGPRRLALLERGGRIINRRYPGYDRWIQAFLAEEPLLVLRRRLDTLSLESKPDRFALLVTLALGGGVDRFVADRLPTLRAQGLTPLVLAPSTADSRSCSLHCDGDSLYSLRYEGAAELKQLNTLLRRLRIEHVELHHFLGLPPAAVQAVLSLGPPYDVYVHDYIWVCPRVTLIDHKGRYCGEPSLDQCERCFKNTAAPGPLPNSVGALRRRSQRWLKGARRVIAPVRDVAFRLQRYFPGIQITVRPWESGVRPVLRRTGEQGTQRPLRVACIGAIGPHKGYKQLLGCARDAEQRQLPIEFTVIGYSSNDQKLIETGRVFVTGRYKDEEVPHLLRREQISVAFFPSVGPETWCYALSHAINAGLPILAFGLGAVSERLRDVPRSVLVSHRSRPDVINDALLGLAARTRDTEYFAIPEPAPVEISPGRTLTPSGTRPLLELQ